MKLSYQVPFRFMDDFIGEADQFFALAHHVMINEKYCNWFIGRETILDNGMHENGVPMNWDDVKQCDEMIGGAIGVIPPDFLYDAKKTFETTIKCTYNWTRGIGSVWPVVQGRTTKDIEWILREYKKWGFEKVCIPYRLGSMMRFRWGAFCVEQLGMQVHFLGLNDFHELKAIRCIEGASLDTGKPFRWAQNGMVYWGHNLDQHLSKLHMEADMNLSWAKVGVKNLREVADFGNDPTRTI